VPFVKLLFVAENVVPEPKLLAGTVPEEQASVVPHANP
jgi:hypothetical protein